MPESTEQILHPEKWRAREAPVAVATPRFEGHKLAEGTLGELRIRLFLARCSKTPAVGGWGWGGDRFVVSDRGLYWATAWDTAGDALRFEGALREVAGACWNPRAHVTRAGSAVTVFSPRGTW